MKLATTRDGLVRSRAVPTAAPRVRSPAGLGLKTAHGLGCPCCHGKAWTRRAVVVRADADEARKQELLESRKYRRTVADHAFWNEHITQDRYSKNMLSFFKSRIIRALSTPLSWVFGVSFAVCTYETCREMGILPSEAPSFLIANPQPQILTSFAVSLLLVFRTNQSYDRWWEARKVWGGILNRCRDMATQGMVFIRNEDRELQVANAKWIVAFARSLHAHLQQDADIRATLSKTLTQSEIDMITSAQHRVVKSLQVLAEVVKTAPMNPIQRQMMMQNVQFFYDAMGMCERIIRTPLPLTYTRMGSRFLFIWTTTLPFALYSQFGWACIPMSLLVAMLLMGIDEIGIQIEEPFGVLPLDAICTRAELDIQQILSEQSQASSYIESFYTPKESQNDNQMTMDQILASNGNGNGNGNGTVPGGNYVLVRYKGDEYFVPTRVDSNSN